ncbi:MAG: aspartate aminotransferase family protein [Trueperaceae bacterium]
MQQPSAKEYPQSKLMYERAKRTLAGGVSSQFRALNAPHPMFYERAAGSRIWDVDGNSLLDFTLSQGPCILGHSHPELISRVSEAISRGQLYAGQFEDELRLAEELQRLIPSAERIRFSSSGSEANHAALRLARHVTGKPKFIKFEGHYHGWFDNVAIGVNPKREQLGAREAPSGVPWGSGIPKETEENAIVLPWNDLSLVEETLSVHGDEVGALVTEPLMSNQGCIEPKPGYLQGLRELCDKFQVALIFDEIITGFRLDLGGAQSHYGVTPDLSVFGKALASGFPLSVIGGIEEFMAPLERNEVYHGGTLNANNASVAAALATVDILERDDAKAHRHIVELGKELRDRLTGLGQRLGLPLKVQGPGPMFHVGFTERDEVTEYRDTLEYDTARYGEFTRRMLDQNIRLIGRGLWYISTAHSQADLDECIAAAEQVLSDMAGVAAAR